VRLTNLTLPQARQTFAVLGVQAPGEWGLLGGVNERHVAVGHTTVATRLPAPRPGLTGGELVRLALERAGSARQAVDCLTDLVTRHGQGDGGADHAFLAADGREGYVVEAAGEHWAVQEVRAVRAVSETCLLRQDWDRISRGLADVAIGKDWWPSDGSKLDFAGVVAPDADRGALRRWGHATLVLEQYSGRLDAGGVRRLLCDHDGAAAPPAAFAGERSLCRYPVDADGPATAASLIAELRGPDRPALAWCAFGPPGLSVYFPVFLDGDLPPALRAAPSEQGCAPWRRLMRLASDRGGADQQAATREALAALQARFDHDAQEALAEAAGLKRLADVVGLRLLLGSFMQACVERFEELWSAQVEARAARPRPAAAAVAEVAGEFWGA
jgi:dipeptidase